MTLFTTSILAAAPAANEGIAEGFGINGPAILAQVILFLIVYLILKKFAFGPIGAMLEERRKTIEAAQLNAEKIRKDLQATESKIEEMLQSANSDSERLINEAKESAEKLGDQRKQQAVAEAQAIIEKANKASEAERAAMMNELKADFGKLVVAATSKVAGKELSAADQERISRETAADLAQ
ncbi:F0F1 ATP synthase subunit B [Sulfuriroseicoccus oceanibius]|uniref:ATP synthase subunit b n=1 Tax=Sulfuriroseicoccus oceanibius TaxID=2707525 RepID=A0A6B3L8T4_9BACT|nr:F0F1 ATP synthase subunit B [Sulfuriroseicoccus oceanibius]QQL43879.1 F0F1 ATP synthase subunit B [Sulfuriroseicoccus oceanibius]